MSSDLLHRCMQTYLRAHLQAEKTYIMLQPTNMDSRLWLDFPSVQKAADGSALDWHR